MASLTVGVPTHKITFPFPALGSISKMLPEGAKKKKKGEEGITKTRKNENMKE
jgi:hypothetical protein